MNRLEALDRLRHLGSPVFRTGEAAMALGQPDSTAHSTLAVLADRHLLLPLRRGWWVLSPPGSFDPGSLVPHLAAPFRAYVSFETALFRHGWITQIPPRITGATLGRSRRVNTAVGSFDLRQLPAAAFGTGDSPEPPWLAVPEKAAFDWAYRAAHQGFFAARFPEIDPPGTVDTAALCGYIEKIPAYRVRVTTARILRERMGLLAEEVETP